MISSLGANLFWFVVGAIVALIATRRLNGRGGNNQAYQKAIADERALWRQQMREDITEFCALTSELKRQIQTCDEDLADETFAKQRQRLETLRVRMRLQVNPDKASTLAGNKLTRATKHVIYLFEINEIQGVAEELVTIERSAEQLLKAEWNQTKTELNPR